MGENTAIEWAHHTFNPWIGCQKVGPGCDHCYAEALATARLGVTWGPGAERRRTAASTWALPRRWNARAGRLGVRERVFCASLADVFDNAVPDQWRRDLALLIRDTPALDWLLLTKRIGNAERMLAEMFLGGTPAHVTVGATLVNQSEVDRDWTKLAASDARRIMISLEPLLGPIRLPGALLQLRRPWVIVGGESGPEARPMHPDWVRVIRDQCELAGVPFLFKQWGAWAPICTIDTDALDARLWAPPPPGDPEAIRRCLVEQSVLHASGRRFDKTPWSRILGENIDTRDFAFASGSRAMTMMRVGKKIAGRALDGVQHDGMPG